MKNQETSSEVTKTETPVVKMKQTSFDEENGIVVYHTDAEDGTGFTLLVNEQAVKAKAENGEVWFYAGHAIAQTDNIRLK